MNRPEKERPVGVGRHLLAKMKKKLGQMPKISGDPAESYEVHDRGYGYFHLQTYRSWDSLSA